MLSQLRRYRLLNDVKLIELAQKAKCAPTLLSEIERRKRSAYPALRQRLSEATGLPIDKLFDQNGFVKVFR